MSRNICISCQQLIWSLDSWLKFAKHLNGNAPRVFKGRVSVHPAFSGAFISYEWPLWDALKENLTLASESSLSLPLGIFVEKFPPIMPYFFTPPPSIMAKTSPSIYHFHLNAFISFPKPRASFSSWLVFFIRSSPAQGAASRLDVTWQLSAEGRRPC